jgi:hypothetical protein
MDRMDALSRVDVAANVTGARSDGAGAVFDGGGMLADRAEGRLRPQTSAAG